MVGGARGKEDCGDLKPGAVWPTFTCGAVRQPGDRGDSGKAAFIRTINKGAAVLFMEAPSIFLVFSKYLLTCRLPERVQNAVQIIMSA